MDSCKKSAVNVSFYWSFLENFLSLGIQFISLIVLSRFISPEDYGLMGIIAIFIAVSNMFVDSGMGASLIKKETVTQLDYSTLFWYNIIVASALYLILFSFSNLIAEFYRIEKISLFIKIIGITIIVNSISIVQNIQLIRNLKFKDLAIITVFANVLSVLTAIVLSINGYGIWALIIQQLVLSCVKMIGLMAFNHFFPSFHFSMNSFKEQFSFGFHLLLSNLLKSVYDNIYSSVIGRFATPKFTGYYVQSSKLQSIPVNLTTSIVDRVMFPVLSRIDKADLFKQAAISLLKKVILIIAPLLFLLSICSSYVIDILLGDKWSGAAWILSILCFSGVAMCIQAVNRNILKSLGITKRIFQVEIFKVLIGLVILLITITLDYIFIIWGILLSSIVSCFVSCYVLSKVMDYSMKEQLFDIFKCLFPGLFSFIALFILDKFFDCTPLYGILINSFIYFLFFVIVTFVFNFLDAKMMILYIYEKINKKICVFFHI